MRYLKSIMAALVFVLCAQIAFADEAKAPEFAKDVAPIFTKYCTGCHNAKEPKGELSLQTFAGAQKGGEGGAIIVPGKPDESRLILVLEKKEEPFMPPGDNKGPSAAEIAILRAWINLGAKGPASDVPDPTSIVTPKIAPTAAIRRPVNAAAISPNGAWIAVARYGVVEVLAAADRRPIATLTGQLGQVNDVGFSSDGSILFAAGGEAGLVGEAIIWNTADWSKRLSIRGHLDAILTAELSPDGKSLATGSYDQKIKLWSTADGTEQGELAGHNGAVFGVAFHNSGKLLASASGDRTIKLWDLEKRTRLDTFNEPTEPQHAVVFSPDGRYVVAGGVDNRVRVWEVLSGGREGTNPIRFARFAHEGPVLDVRFSPDGKLLVTSSQDRTIKLWETHEFTQLQVIKDQPDWVSTLVVAPDNSRFLAGRLDGTLTSYPVNTAAGRADIAKPIDTSAALVLATSSADANKPAESAEAEPNDAVEKATPMSTPGVARGVFMAEGGKADIDVYRFSAKAGETWIIETRAAQDNSPADTNIEILTADGKPIERVLLRAIRDSYIEFRPIDSSQSMARVKNWEEMKLNQFMYLNGEVCKLFRAPRGPDSGWDFYLTRGKRHNYFDTSGTIHANGDTVYIVEPYLPGTELVDNGLPVFKVNYTNDDDGERRLGSDSRVTFKAPADGEYTVRVTDMRGFSGADYKYALIIRRPVPDFNVSLGGRSGTVSAGSAREISVQLDRIDGFNGEVRVDIAGMPPGFTVSTPIVVEAGHNEAQGVVTAAADVQPDKTADDPVSALRPGQENPELKNKVDWSTVKVKATATVLGQTVQKDVENLGDWKVAKRPKYIVKLEPDTTGSPSPGTTAGEIVMPPGTRISAMLRVERAPGFNGELRFDVNNLPHGVIVDDIGLSGVLVRENESERRIFLTADDWLTDTTRLVHAISRVEGNESSQPVLFRIRRNAGAAQASANE